jgi:hypothetical protein
MIDEPVTLDLQNGAAVAPVLTRVATMIAARAGIELDRIGDLGIVAETIAPAVPEFTVDGRVRIAVSAGDPGVVVLRIGPLRTGGAEALRTACLVPGIGSVVDRLADRTWVDPGADGEYWAIEIVAGAALHAR